MAPETAGSPTKLVSPAAGKLDSSKRSTPTSAVSLHLFSAKTTPTAQRIVRPLDRESESSLSDLGEGDSEAETERLHISPQKPRQKVVLQHTNNATISTLSAEASVEEETAITMEEESTDSHLNHSAPTSPTVPSPSKKRKRDENESPNRSLVSVELIRPSTPPPKKKPHTPDDNSAALENTTGDLEVATTVNCGSLSKKAVLTNGINETPEADSLDKAETSDPVPELDPEPPAADKRKIDTDGKNQITDSPSGEQPDDTAVDPGREEDEDAERDIRRKQAMDELAEIERVFAQLKDSLYSERLHRVELEMKLLNEGRHPEYIAQKHCLDQRLEEKVRLANAQYKYAMESLDIATNVTKAQLHSQYYQRTRQIRQDTLYNCSEEIYNITRERRAGDALVPEYTYRIPERHGTRVKARQQYNWEVALLAGIAKTVGFPAAPDVNGVTDEELVDDLEAIGISRVASRLNAPLAPPTAGRFEDPYERLTPVHWSQRNQSPPSPASHSAFSAHQHAHLHRHHHHHHRPHAHVTPQGPSRPPSQLQEHVQYPPRRIPSFGSQPAHNVPLSSLLQSDGAVKMETQGSSHGSYPSIKTGEPFGTPLPFHGNSQHSPRPAQPSTAPNHGHPFARPNSTDAPASHNSPQARMRDVAASPEPSDVLMTRGPGGSGREHDMEHPDMRNLKEAEILNGGLAGPLKLGVGRIGYS